MSPPGPLLTVRTSVVLLLALVTGLVAGVVGFFAYRDVPTGILVGGGAASGALVLFHGLLAH